MVCSQSCRVLVALALFKPVIAPGCSSILLAWWYGGFRNCSIRLPNPPTLEKLCFEATRFLVQQRSAARGSPMLFTPKQRTADLQVDQG